MNVFRRKKKDGGEKWYTGTIEKKRTTAFQNACHIVRKQVNALFSQWLPNNPTSYSVINLFSGCFFYIERNWKTFFHRRRFYWRLEFSQSKHVLIEGVNKLGLTFCYCASVGWQHSIMCVCVKFGGIKSLLNWQWKWHSPKDSCFYGRCCKTVIIFLNVVHFVEFL